MNLNNEIDHTHLYNELRLNITSKLVIPSYYNDVKELLKWRYRWRMIGNTTLTFSKIFIAINALLSFAALTFSLPLFPFMAGCISVFSFVLLHFSTFSFSRSKESTQEVNEILTSLGIKAIPDIIPEKEADNESTESKTTPLQSLYGSLDQKQYETNQ